jgi:hypothetical protein
MSNPSASRFRLIFALAACSLIALPAVADSQARIVRLSDVQGTVQIDKNSGLGFESAFINLPITQGTQLKTGGDGRAEIEFEDGSSLRMAPNTSIEFSTLGLSDAGSHLSQVNLTEGMAYVNWLGKNHDEFTLTFSREKLSLDQPAHFRVDASLDVANLAVFKGDVEIEGPAGKVTVEKKKTATFDASQDDKSTVANNITEAPLDSWDKEASAYHDEYAKNNSSPYGYGASDLGYYGAYTNVPGYGMMWQPYFTGVGWDPFMDGAWGWYPGFGYIYASAYPWGWLPYRYGNWMFVPGFGWMWQPGGWNTWVPVPRYTPTTTAHVTPLVAPPAGTVKTVTVGRGSSVTPLSAARLAVNTNSAGFGIPRGSVQNMAHLNHQVTKSGFAEVRSAPQFAASSSRSSGFGGSHPSMEPTASRSPSMGHSTPVGHSSGTSHH